MRPDLPRLHVVTDDRVLAEPNFPGEARRVLREAGARLALHIRGRSTTARRLFQLTLALRATATDSGAFLIVNDRIDVALAAGADGVQLGGQSLAIQDLPGDFALPLGVGVSLHSAAEARAAGPADWFLVGTLWPTASHPGRPGQGPNLVTEVLDARGDLDPARSSARALGIGGVTPERVGAVLQAGGHGVAVLGTIWDAPDPAVAAQHYLQEIESVLSGGSPS